MKILVVCSGNICRSPLAAELLRRRSRELGLSWVTIESAGTLGIVDAEAAPETIDAGREMGLDLTGHRSQGVTAQVVSRADLVLAMERGHLVELERCFPRRPEVHLLRAFEHGPEPRADAPDVDDPIGESPAFHRACAATVARCVDHVLEYARRRRAEKA
jgi:protein-tyrosine phosphatase